VLRGVSQLKGVTRVGILYTALGFLERDRDVRSLSEFISRPHDHVKMCARLGLRRAPFCRVLSTQFTVAD